MSCCKGRRTAHGVLFSAQISCVAASCKHASTLLACAHALRAAAHLCVPHPQGPAAAGLGPQLTVFHGLRAPPISIEAYLVRIAKYAKCSPACFVHSMVHMLKLAQHDASFAPTRLNVHRLLLTGVLISAKFLDDRYFNNAFYAKVGSAGPRAVSAALAAAASIVAVLCAVVQAVLRSHSSLSSCRGEGRKFCPSFSRDRHSGMQADSVAQCTTCRLQLHAVRELPFSSWWLPAFVIVIIR